MTSTLDPDNLSNREPPRPKGHDIRSLGPSDSSDSGSDIASAPASDDEFPLADEEPGGIGRDDDSDRYGTGEQMTANREPGLRANGDIEFDRVVDSGEAGLGGGLDQAEEAQLGIQDEDEPNSRRGERPAKGS